MTSILALDSSADTCSIALLHEGRITVSESDTPKAHARLVLPLISDLLGEARLKVADLDAIAVVSGPGSFTGLRIGIGVAQGLALAAERPVVLVSSLAAIAATAAAGGAQGVIAVSLKARDGEIYFGAFETSSAGIKALQPEKVLAPSALQAADLARSSPNIHAVGDGWTVPGMEEHTARIGDLALDTELKLDIRAVVELARIKLAAGDTVAAELALPNYLKEQMNYALADPPAGQHTE